MFDRYCCIWSEQRWVPRTLTAKSTRGTIFTSHIDLIIIISIIINNDIINIIIISIC